MEEKFATASKNNSKELLDQKSEILNVCSHKKVDFLVGSNKLFYLVHYLLFHSSFIHLPTYLLMDLLMFIYVFLHMCVLGFNPRSSHTKDLKNDT